MKTKRDSSGHCLRCGDTAKTKDGGCFYCNWKGFTGPGELLKGIIKNENAKNTKSKNKR